MLRGLPRQRPQYGQQGEDAGIRTEGIEHSECGEGWAAQSQLMNMLECRVPAYHSSTPSQLPTLPMGILLSSSIQRPSMRILVLASTRQSGTRRKCVSSAELGSKLSTQTRKKPKDSN